MLASAEHSTLDSAQLCIAASVSLTKPLHAFGPSSLRVKTPMVLCRQQAKNLEENNSAVEVYFQCGPDSLQLRTALDLLDQVVSEPCFNALRTQQQLAYSVSSGIRLTHNTLGFVFSILSGKHPASFLKRLTAQGRQMKALLAANEWLAHDLDWIHPHCLLDCR